MIKLLIMFGGQSSEHVVSCSSASSLISHIDSTQIQHTVVGITKDGRWYLTPASEEDIKSGAWENHPGNLPAFLSPNRSMSGLQVLRDGKLESIDIDCIYPVMHGELCEDGAIQGLFELCGIPYVGPNICASACCMDKTVTKLVVESTDVCQAKYCIVTAAECGQSLEKAALRVEEHFGGGYPFFVKPASAGSSVGVSKAHNRAEIEKALSVALEVCSKVLVEETIVGREVEVAVLGNEDPKASVVGEVLAANEFYDFNAKYENSVSRTEIPARISPEDSEQLRAAAIKVYRSLGCEGMSRVDFFLQSDGKVVFNEINTLPGFTNISMYPKLWEATGISYSRLLVKLCELAMERGCMYSK